jgi:ketosteroid isomerase-like protein
MKYILIFFLVPFSFDVFSQQKDSLAIVNLIMDDYTTMGTWNLKRHVENTTKTYLLIEKGEVLNLKMESDFYKSNAHRVIDRKNYFDFKHLRISGNNAYAIYNLKSDIIENGILKTYTWIESVIFKKINKQWKIELIHSTPIEKK